MPGLTSILSTAVSALLANQGALDNTANNVANANTPGYSRKQVLLAENTPVVLGTLTFGTGVSLQRLESLRDPILQLRIQQETQQQGALNSFVSSLQQSEVMFNNTTGGDLSALLSNFFGSLQQLSTDPANLSSRQSVLTSAGNLAKGFNSISTNLSQQRTGLDLSVVQDVQQVNLLTGQIAKVNVQISALEAVGGDPGNFIDQRDLLIGKLSQLIDVSSIKSDNGLTLTTSNGSPLVAGAQNFTLTTQTDPSGVQRIFSQGNDITNKINAGGLAGLLDVRDGKVPTLISNLDSLAAAFATAVNNANQAGFALTGAPGGNLFVPPPVSGTGAAAILAVATTDPALVAASSDGTPGSNGNLAGLLAIHDQPLVSGQAPTDYYSNIVFGVGSDVSNASAEQQASSLVLQQLQDQRGSISGVSLDEEAGNMLLYQRAYDAAARLVSTVNEMLDVAVNLGRY